MKICVLVKEVPDAAVDKRINPQTGHLDRSGEKNLNPFDTHAIEAAMQLKEGGAIAVRSLIPHRVHASIGVLGAVSVATACLIEGSPAGRVAKVGQGRELTLGVEHPTGVTECVVSLDEAGQPVRAGMLRTARKLMDGEVFA